MRLQAAVRRCRSGVRPTVWPLPHSGVRTGRSLRQAKRPLLCTPCHACQHPRCTGGGRGRERTCCCRRSARAQRWRRRRRAARGGRRRAPPRRVSTRPRPPATARWASAQARPWPRGRAVTTAVGLSAWQTPAGSQVRRADRSAGVAPKVWMSLPATRSTKGAAVESDLPEPSKLTRTCLFSRACWRVAGLARLSTVPLATRLGTEAGKRGHVASDRTKRMAA